MKTNKPQIGLVCPCCRQVYRIECERCHPEVPPYAHGHKITV